MSLLKRLASLLGREQAERPTDTYRFRVQCARCGEVLEGRVNLANDLSADYGEEGAGPLTYMARKVLVGSGRCFQPVEVRLTLDEARRVTDRQAAGGIFVD